MNSPLSEAQRRSDRTTCNRIASERAALLDPSTQHRILQMRLLDLSTRSFVRAVNLALSA